jgi:hypothetical protein
VVCVLNAMAVIRPRAVCFLAFLAILGTLDLYASSISMRMGLTETLGMLPEARRFVVEGARLVMQQRAVVQNLELDGYETLDALRHLELLEGMQAEYIDHLEKLERAVLILVKPDV